MSIEEVQLINAIPPLAVNSVASALSLAIDRVKALRDEKDNLDIVYEGLTLQVSVKDRENITGRLETINSQLSLGQSVALESLFWRDSFNVVHTWADVDSYKAWLQGLIVSYGNRRGAIYVRSWQHGAALKAISEQTLGDAEKIQAILSYDITTGW